VSSCVTIARAVSPCVLLSGLSGFDACVIVKESGFS
jgi:hypothetical protein